MAQLGLTVQIGISRAVSIWAAAGTEAMPITHRIDKSAAIAFVTVAGKLTLEEMTAGMDRVLGDPDFEPGFRVLSDHSSIEEPVTRPQVEGLVAHAQSVDPRFHGTRWAVVASKDASYGMMRMLAILAESVPLEVEVFRDLDEALGWLGPV